MNGFSSFAELTTNIDIPKELSKVNSVNKIYKNIFGAVALIAVVAFVFYIEKHISNERK